MGGAKDSVSRSNRRLTMSVCDRKSIICTYKWICAGMRYAPNNA